MDWAPLASVFFYREPQKVKRGKKQPLKQGSELFVGRTDDLLARMIRRFGRRYTTHFKKQLRWHREFNSRPQDISSWRLGVFLL